MRDIKNAFGARQNTIFVLMFALVTIVISWAATTSQVQKVSGSDVAHPTENSSRPEPSAFACVAPPAGMINWYPGDGDANDIRGGRNGTLRNGAGFAPGKVLQAFSLDGVNDYVDVGDVDLPATFTIDAWVNPVQTGPGSRVIIAKDNLTSRSYAFYFNAGKLYLDVFSAAGVTEYVTVSAVGSINVWQHLAVTYDGGAGVDQKIKFYVNGVSVAATHTGSNDVGGSPNNTSPSARIGIFGNDQFAYQGLIDEVDTFSRVLSAAELQQIFAADVDGKCKGPIPTPSPTPRCAFTITPTDQDFPPGGGSGSVTVTQTSSGQPCEWSAVPAPRSDPFITLTTGSSGVGNGSFGFSVATDSGTGRSGVINLDTIVGGEFSTVAQFTVRQLSDGCTYAITPPERTFSRAGGEGSLEVRAPSTCSWTAAISGGLHVRFLSGEAFFQNGAGDRVLGYRVEENTPDEFRIISITVKNQAHLIRQQGKDCPIENIINELKPAGDSTASTPDQFRGFRDDVLAKTKLGRRYSDDYYLYAGEITKLMIFNPGLFFRSKDVLGRYQPVVESVLRRERAKADQERRGTKASQADLEPTVVFESEIDDVTDLLAAFSEKSSGSLRETLDGLRRDIRDPQVQAEFGVRIEPGEKRPLRDKDRLPVWTVGVLSFLDLQFGVRSVNIFSVATPDQTKSSPPER